MLFTEGRDREYERMMTEVPKERHNVKKTQTVLEIIRDCQHCMYYKSKEKRCKFNRCIVFPK